MFDVRVNTITQASKRHSEQVLPDISCLAYRHIWRNWSLSVETARSTAKVQKKYILVVEGAIYVHGGYGVISGENGLPVDVEMG
jgi:Ni,Fe-hydrogenase I small subunit